MPKSKKSGSTKSSKSKSKESTVVSGSGKSEPKLKEEEPKLSDGEFAEFEGEGSGGRKPPLFDSSGPEEDEEEDEVAKEPSPPEVVLSKEDIRQGLSMIGRTVDNFQYAYIRFDGSGHTLANVDALADYLHLRILNLSENRLRSLLPLCSLKHLLVLNAHTNAIESFEEIPTWPYLQALSLMSNRLSSLKGLYSNHIAYLQLSFNGFDKLEEFDGNTFYGLRTLELRGNQLSSLKGLSVQTLEHLFAAQNNLRDISGLNCPNLATLHLRDNEITKLEDFPPLPNLKYLNLRSNLVSRFTQTQHLSRAPNLAILVLLENPVCGSEIYRVEMLAALPLLTRIDKLLCTEAELIEGRSLSLGRLKNAEGVAPLQDDPNVVVSPIYSTPNVEQDGEDAEESVNLFNAGSTVSTPQPA